MSDAWNTADVINQDWYDNEMNMGDGGYGDSFRALKAQIDYNYNRYKEQLVSLENRRLNLTNDKKASLKMLLIIMFAPAVLLLFVQIFTYLGALHGIFGIFAVGGMILQPFAVVVCEFFLLPGATRNLVNNMYRDKVLNLPGDGNRIITFVDEKKFLFSKIHEIENFYERVEQDGIDQKGGRFKLGASSGELNDSDKKILDDMRSLSLFTDYKATVSELKREAGMAWLLIGLGILVGISVVILVYALRSN